MRRLKILHKTKKASKGASLPQKMATKPTSACRSSWKRCSTNCELTRGKLQRLYIFPATAHCFITQLYLMHQGHFASPKHILQEALTQFLLIAAPDMWPTVDLHAPIESHPKCASFSTKDYSPFFAATSLPQLQSLICAKIWTHNLKDTYYHSLGSRLYSSPWCHYALVLDMFQVSFLQCKDFSC